MATTAPKLTDAQKLRVKQREARELRAALQQLSDNVLLFLDGLDTAMKGPESPQRGKAVARLSNALDMVNDRVRFGPLGVDFRADDKATVLQRIREGVKR